MGNPTFGNGKSGRGGGTGSASVQVTPGSILSGDGTSVNPLDATIVVTPNTGIQGVGTVASPLAGIPATALVPGTLSAVDFAKLATVPTGVTIPIIFATPEIDFTVAAPQTVPFLNAVIPGKRFLTLGNANIMRSLLTVVAGTLTTQPMYVWGNNTGTVDNYNFVAGICVATAQFAAGAGASASAGGIATTIVPLDLSNGLAVKITTAANGVGTTCKGIIYIPGFLI